MSIVYVYIFLIIKLLLQLLSYLHEIPCSEFLSVSNWRKKSLSQIDYCMCYFEC